MNDNKNPIQNLSIELKELLFFSVERIVMTKCHLEKVKNYILRRNRMDLQTISYINCLKKMLKGLICNTNAFNLALNIDEREKVLKNFYPILGSVKQLQAKLNILPKEDVPIELHRFLRIFHRDGLSQSQEKNDNVEFVLYLSEQNSASIFASSPLSEFEKNHLLPALKGIDLNSSTSVEQTRPSLCHIIVPRVETSGPLYWPILAHEIAHQIMDLGYFESRKITQDWTKCCGPLGDDAFSISFRNIIKYIDTGLDENKVFESWLTECWCDLYAYFAVGPAFIFAQKGTFLFNKQDGNLLGDEKHPPSFLRLMLLYQFAKLHQNDLLKEYDMLGDLPILYPAKILLPIDENLKKDLNNVINGIYEYFKRFFDLEKSRTDELHDHIRKLKENSTIYNRNIFHGLINRLNNNYPVPSLIVDTENLIEKETTVQEVMLSAWLSYEDAIKKNTIETICKDLQKLNGFDIDELWEYFNKNISPIFERFNESVLRSLQIGEWVKLLKAEIPSHKTETNPISESKSRYCILCHECEFSLLVDHEIKELIREDSLKIIPLIDISTQLGACSLDIRLGPSFQTYQPNQSGVVDLKDEESVANVFKNSTDIDLDFMEALVLAPGQFVLAHTMEYVGLPENIAAQIEGRSTFGRLGLQVHMTANLIDPGFHGSITFEIFNAGPNPIRLYPGYRVGQLRFFKSKQPLNPYNIKKNAKFKGMFIHSSSLLDRKDYEVERIKKFLSRRYF